MMPKPALQRLAEKKPTVIENGKTRLRPPLKQPAPPVQERKCTNRADQEAPPGNRRNRAIFDRLDAEINRDAAPHRARKRQNRAVPARLPRRLMAALEKDVDEFAAHI